MNSFTAFFQQNLRILGTYEGHEYFGLWKTTHDPLFHEDITGPVESFNGNGTGYEEAEVGEGFLRIGVGILEKENNKPYVWNHKYKILDHGQWTINQGNDWIEFIHEAGSNSGWACRYTKRISLTNDKPGFIIHHKLENTGEKAIQTNQFNHNFFVIDGTGTGPDFSVEFPFEIKFSDWNEQIKKQVTIGKNQLRFKKYFLDESVWMLLLGYESDAKHHQFTIRNHKTGAGVQVKADKPLCRLAFWANPNTLCPENFVCLDIAPGETGEWVSEYSLFINRK